MYFDSFSDFLTMDGHGRYVWLAHGIFVLVFAFNIFLALSSRAESKKQVMRSLRRAELAEAEGKNQ